MCTFSLQVEQCGCNDVECKQMNPEIQDDKWDNVQTGGHVLRVTQYYRTSGVCLHWFINEDPDRLMVLYGMDPNNGNSKVDCTKKIFIYQEERFYSEHVCLLCQQTCKQPVYRGGKGRRGAMSVAEE